MGKTSVFDLDPERLNRLLAIGRQEPDSARAEASEPAPAIEAPGEEVGSWVGRYKLLRVLGEGGMGIVYLAEQEHPMKRQVALKVIKPGMDSKRVIARFEAERQTLALLDHPNIAHVHDAGTTKGGRPYFVMEHVDGLPITEHCDRYKLRIDERLRLFAQVCQAIHHAHQKGIIHRDIKPSNILVTVQDGEAVPKVIDFGVARALSQPLTGQTLLTQQGQLVGTPEYMSPEQIDLAREGADVRSDVYSLGVLLYVLLAGALPLEPETLQEGGLEQLRRMIREQDPKTPSTRLAGLGEKATEVALNRGTDTRTLARSLHKELEWIPLKAIRKEREQRYQSAAELAQDVRNYLVGVPLVAGRPSRVYTLKKLVMRHRTSITAILIVALTIVVGSVVSMTMYVRAKVQSGQARAVSSFLSDSVLYALDPEEGQGGEVTPLSILDMVSAALEGRFRSSPLIEAELRHRLGDTYMAQRRYRPAARHLERALEIRRRELGNDDLLTVSSMFILGEVYQGLGRTTEAEPLLLEAVTQRTRQLGPENDATLYAAIKLGWNYEARQRYDRAVRLYQDVLKAARRVAGDTHLRAMLAMYSIGYLNILQNRYDEAERWLRKALELSRQSASQVARLPTEVTGCLGMVYLLQGRHAEAEPILKDWVARLSRTHGEGYWETLQSLEWLIYLYVVWDKPEEAAKWHAKLEAAKRTDPGNLSGSVKYEGTTATYVIRSAGRDIWGLFDDFHFAHKTLHGDGSVTARIDSVEEVHDWTKAGIMIRKTLEPSSENASIFVTPAGVVSFQYRLRQGGMTLFRSGCSRPVTFPHWIRLTRRGKAFTAEHSADGVIWEVVHDGDPNRAGPVEITMDQTVHVGLALTSHDVGRMAEARISNVALRGDTSPIGLFTTSEDISVERLLSSAGKSVAGATADSNEATAAVPRATESLLPADDQPTARQLATLALQHGGSVGSLKYEEATATYTIVGAGRDIWFKSDEFHLAYKELTGDGSVVARIDAIQPVHLWTKAGVMIRNTLTSDSEHASVFLTPGKRVCFQYRATAGQNALSIHTDPNAVALPHWVKLVRTGNVFKAQHSHDGLHWRDLQGSNSAREPAPTAWTAAPEIQMKQKVYVGLAVTSNAGPLPAEAKISQVSITGNVSPPGELVWSEDIGFQVIMLPKK